MTRCVSYEAASFTLAEFNEHVILIREVALNLT